MKKGINLNNLDLTINPRDDFYMYACGGWMKNNPLPAEFSSFGTFNQLREDARKQLQDLILELQNDPESKISRSIAQKVSDLFNMGMDAERLNSEGASPIFPTLSKIEDFSKDKLIDYLAWLHMGLDSSFFSTGVGSHPADSDLNIMHIGETGLGLGDRDYYLVKSEENDRILAAYEKYVKTLMALIGKDENEQQRIWDSVISLETDFAEHKMSREDKRDPLKRFNMFTLSELKQSFSNIDWDKYFQLLDVDVKEANVSSVDFLKFINKLLPKISEQAVKDYLLFSLTTNSSGLMSDDFTDANFEMYGKVMSGQKEQKPRWKRAMALPDSMFGEAVGQLYVAKYFPEENKSHMLNLVENLRKSLASHINNLPWMSEETKKRALDKLEAMNVKIGYPDKWKDYSEITIDPALTYLENVQKASVWFAKDNYSKLGKPVDKTEWHMTPQTVNAYYSPISNEICFPAAILQPPFFDINADDALNYGAIGSVIGHEMTHGFDDQGRQFDKNGNLNNWWEESDSIKFKDLTEGLVSQFDLTEVAPGVFANGRFTLGENIADQGGLRVSLSAYLDSIDNSVTIDGLSPLQRFFLSYANVWAGNITPEEILLRTKTDPHSLGRNRVNVTLRNLDEFFEAFDIREGDPMFRKKEERVIIW